MKQDDLSAALAAAAAAAARASAAKGPLGLSVIVPMHDEEDNVGPLFGRLLPVLNALALNSEVIVVDDGSRDGTAAKLQALAAQDRRIRILSFRRNYGQTAAMMAGIDHARGEVIVPMDGDLQNDPTDIPRLLAKLAEGYDVVSGWRKDRHDKKLRSALSRGANRLISWISGVSLHDYGCTLKAYHHEVIKDIRLYGEMHRFVPIYASWQGGRVTELEVQHHPRRHGSSHYGMNRIVKVLLDLMVVQFLSRYDTKPIYVFGAVGVLSIAVSFLAGLWALYLKWFEGVDFIQTPLPLLVVMTFLTGVMCTLMGLLAELLVRVYYEAQGKTIYSIRGRTNFDDA